MENSGKSEILSWILTLVAAVVIALIVRTFVFNIAVVNGSSMEETLHDRDVLISNRAVLFIRNPKREEIVVFHSPTDNKKLNIKRVIGLPGETVELKDGKFHINGEILAENYLEDDAYTLSNSDEYWQLGENEYFLVGDNRNPGKSFDSRATGPVNKSEITGITGLRLFPFNQFGGI